MKSQNFDKRFRFTVILIICILIGAFLRLYLITDQILLDDEWHGLFYATGHPLTHLLYHTTADATCAPLNVYAWILLHTIGWSEMALRLPSLVFGLLALLVLPLLVRRIHGEAVACIFAVFLSLSPFLTLYSRIFRPYSALTFLEFVAIYSAGIWLQTGTKRFHLLYLFASTAALYFHPVAAIGVFAPWAVAGVLYFLRDKNISSVIRIPEFLPDRWNIIITAGLVASLFALIVQPAIINKNMVPGYPMMIETWNSFLMMLFGTSEQILAWALLFICMVGVWTLFRKHLFWGAVIGLVVLLHIIMIVVFDFAGINVPVVLARYLTILFPLSYVCVAIGLIQIAIRIVSLDEPRKPFVRNLVMILLAILIFVFWVLTNPLRYIYSAPNNFTNHPAFIESGQPHVQVSTLGPPLMSSFYRKMPQQTRRLIEYPMMLGDHYNLYYFYQHYHGKQIVIGYTDMVDSMPLHRDGVGAEFFINHVIHAVDDKRSIKFRNMVDILDAEAIRRSQADYLICHKNLHREFLPREEHSSAKTIVPGFKECVEHSTKHFGPPVFENKNIVVFDVADKLPDAS